VLGNCGETGRPYLEGPQIYQTSSFGVADIPGPYLLVVAAKPDNPPAECTGYPQPDKPNEVLAYATATSPQGPYTYQGILMCGSSTEWTNQGSLLMMPDQTGTNRLVLFYHDGPDRNMVGSPERKVHAECLFYGSGNIAMVTRSESWTDLGFSSPTFSSCMANANYSDDSTVGLMFSGAWGPFAPPQHYVTAENQGASDLVFNRPTIGPWERFHLNVVSSGQSNENVDIQSLANGEWVTTQIDGHLLANSVTLPSSPQFSTDGSIWNGRGCTHLVAYANNGALGLDNSGLVLAQGSVGSTPVICTLHM
jgi:hypothetical protein